MTSERKIAANRINGSKGRGPRSHAGKLRSSRNARRHGLSALGRHNPECCEEIERMAKEICGPDPIPSLREQALVIAENEFLLRYVRIETVAAIERLRNPTARPLTKRDNSLAVARTTWDEACRAHDETMQAIAWKESGEPEQPSVASAAAPPIDERDEASALYEAIPDLDRLSRYERRAWSRRKRAIRELITIRLSQTG